jgi:tetratricopeptide (TPR) repeat protein
MNIPEELMPLVEWWEKDGKKTLACLLAAAVAVGAFYGIKGYKASQAEKASQALLQSYSTEDLEAAVKLYGKTATGSALKLRLAKSYFDNDRYDEALAMYDSLMTAAPAGFEDVPAVGRAQCLEALGKNNEALKEYKSFLEAKPKSFLAIGVKISIARVEALLGNRDKAISLLEEIKKSQKDDKLTAARVDSAIEFIKGLGKKATPAPAPAPAAPAKEQPKEKSKK